MSSSPFRDISAGLTVAALLIPQSMAYALIAGVPPIYGLYSSLVPLAVYAIVGSSRQLAVGIVAIDMFIVADVLGNTASGEQAALLAMAIALSGIVGLLQLLLGAFRLGFVVRFLTRPVIVGFASAAPLLIAASQLQHILGVSGGDSMKLHSIFFDLAGKLQTVNLHAVLFSALTFALLLLLRKLHRLFPAALACMVVAISASLALPHHAPTVGTVPKGLPHFSVPALSMDGWLHLIVPAAVLTLVQLMSVVSLGRVFARKHGYPFQANREFLAIGAANFCGMWFQSLPVSGSFSRTAVNSGAGAQSPYANLFTAMSVALVVVFLTDVLEPLPVAVLAAIIVFACIGMIDLQGLFELASERRRDAVVAIGTFVATLELGIVLGLLVGIGAGLLEQAVSFSQAGKPPQQVNEAERQVYVPLELEDADVTRED